MTRQIKTVDDFFLKLYADQSVMQPQETGCSRYEYDFGEGSMILFLDFDGVLHPWHEQTNLDIKEMFVFVPRLAQTLRAFPEVDIVISSSWRGKYELDQLRHLFPADIGMRIIDVTPPSERDDQGRYPAGCRGQEIQQWLVDSQRAIEPWLAIDDMGWMFDEDLLAEHVVLCDSEAGLTEEKNQELTEKIAQMLAGRRTSEVVPTVSNEKSLAELDVKQPC